MRTGSYVTVGSIRCFSPAPLPPMPPVKLDGPLALVLSEADQALARLDGATSILPNPDLFVYAFMRQEAVLSSQIEGTQASLDDLFEFEGSADTQALPADVSEVINYIAAMNWALTEIRERPISLNLICEMHARLLANGRGAERGRGEFRRNQNWIGPPGCSLQEATFVPPAVPLMRDALNQLELFIHAADSLPPLLKLGLVHAQFETIHPFWDGNGRLGRMLITLLLCERGIMTHPVVYPSLFFKIHREEYYRRLQATRDDQDWEAWLVFFLRAIRNSSRSALETARKIIHLEAILRNRIPSISGSSNAYPAIQRMFSRPIISVKQLAADIGVTYPTANSILTSFSEFGIAEEMTGGRRDRLFAFRPYLDLLHEVELERNPQPLESISTQQ